VLRAYLDGSGRADAGHAEHGGAMPADSSDSLVDLGAFAGGELAEVTGYFRDQPPDPGDLVLRGHGFCLGPFLDVWNAPSASISS
jgi:hypothetical protein